MNILLVEDDYLLGRSTARLIEKASSHRVRLTHKAADIFKHCQSGWTQLVLMDVNLPGTFWENREVTGIDLSYLLKTQAKTAQLPIVLLTASTTDREQGQLLSESMADGIYAKPINDTEGFLSLLQQLWVSHKSLDDFGGFQGLTASAS